MLQIFMLLLFSNISKNLQFFWSTAWRRSSCMFIRFHSIWKTCYPVTSQCYTRRVHTHYPLFSAFSRQCWHLPFLWSNYSGTSPTKSQSKASGIFHTLEISTWIPKNHGAFPFKYYAICDTYSWKKTHRCIQICFFLWVDTVDGRNPAPPGMYKTL